MDDEQDALLALRQAIKSKDTITYIQNGEPCQTLLSATHLLVSPTCTLAKSAPTRYRRPGVLTSAGPDDFFSVEAVYLAWLLQTAPGADYMKQARENGLAVGFVSVTERKNVVDWLEGRIHDHERILPLVGATNRLFPNHTHLILYFCSRDYNTSWNTTIHIQGTTCNTSQIHRHNSNVYLAFEATVRR
jgi:parafibromin